MSDEFDDHFYIEMLPGKEFEINCKIYISHPFPDIRGLDEF